MDPGILIGALAIGTIGVVFIALAWHFAKFLRNPENRDHAHNVFVRDGKAASTVTAEQAAPGSQEAQPLYQRLNQSIASKHEVDPSQLETQEQRTIRFKQDRINPTVSPAATQGGVR